MSTPQNGRLESKEKEERRRRRKKKTSKIDESQLLKGSNARRRMTSLTLPQLKLPTSFGRTKFWKKRTVTISDLDPQFRVTYLGNVLTGWAKGDGCLDKPLATLWRNHLSSDKPHILMKVTIAASGLKALTKEHGLTEYWAHRVTYCKADPNYPKVFCWIYRHEGRKMKQELRCHAVLCPSENKANLMAQKLQERLHQALIDFKKEKISRQNARLSLANTIYENPTMPNRKIMLHTGSSNYRPPHDRGKSAPKLKVIEEVILEEDEEYESDEITPTSEEDLSNYAMNLCRSRSAPLSNPEDDADLTRQNASRSSRIVNFSDETTETSLASSLAAGADVGQLLDIEDSDLSFLPMNTEDNLSSCANHNVRSGAGGGGGIGVINHRLVASFDIEDFECEEDDEDVITDYLPGASSSPNAAARHVPTSAEGLLPLLPDDSDSAASVSPDSQFFSTRSSERRSKNDSIKMKGSDHLGLEGDTDSLHEEISKMKLSEQDAISDESGYSEESSQQQLLLQQQQQLEKQKRCNSRGQLLSGKTTLVTLNTSLEEEKVGNKRNTCDNSDNNKDEIDLTVQSGKLSDVSSAKYLEKKREDTKEFLQNRITEFCINI